MSERVVYLDTNILSRVSYADVPLELATALVRLADLGGLRFVTSEKTRSEILQTPNPVRNALLQFVFAVMDKVRFRFLHYSGAIGATPIGAVPLGGSWTDPLLVELKGIFDPDDAEHIAQAVHADCDFFLTLDAKTILDRAEANRIKVRNLCRKLVFSSPQALVALIERERASSPSRSE